jgi:hypothetical protein
MAVIEAQNEIVICILFIVLYSYSTERKHLPEGERYICFEFHLKHYSDHAVCQMLRLDNISLHKIEFP